VERIPQSQFRHVAVDITWRRCISKLQRRDNRIDAEPDCCSAR
jgi:hypothetical protein